MTHTHAHTHTFFLSLSISLSCFCLILMSIKLGAQAPGIEWQKTYYAPIHPGSAPNNQPPAGPQTKANSGEDWFYDVKLATDASNNPMGFIGVGYSSFVNSETPLNDDNCYEFVNGSGLCDEFEYTGWVKGNPRPKMALVDLKGNLLWYKSYGERNGTVGLNGRFYNVIQTSDHGFLAVGRLKISSTANGIGYNPDATHPLGYDLVCNDSNGTKGYVVKTDINGNVLWQFTYGYVDDPSIADDFGSVVYDAVETANAYLICGRADNIGQGYTRAAVIKINKSNGQLLSKVFVGNAGKESWIRAATLDPTGGTMYITGKEYAGSGVGFNLFVQRVNTSDLTVINNYTYTVNIGIDKHSIGYDIAYDAANSHILVAGVMGVDIAAENSQGDGQGRVYILSTTLSYIAEENLGGVKAYDLQIGLTTLSDGNFAVTVPKQSFEFSDIDNEVCGIPFPEEDNEGLDLWNTDVYVAKYMGNNPYYLIWDKTIDYDSPQAIHPFGDPKTQGNLKRQECVYEIVEAPDGGLLIGGNCAENFDDDYLLKLFCDCESRTAYGPSDINQSTYTVGVSETWTASKKVNSSIIIPDGHTLTITGSSTVIQMADTRKVGRPCNIVIQPKGKLVMSQGSKITGLQSCNSLWEGIQVEGNPYQISTLTNQGSARIYNNCTIENMREGLVTDQLVYQNLLNGTGPDYSKSPVPSYSMTGGIVQSWSASFLNCKRVAYFPPYPLTLSISQDNASFFNNSSMKCNQYLPGELDDATALPYGTNEFIRIENNHGIVIYRDLIENTIAGLSLDKKGIGIKAVDASFQVLGSYDAGFFNNLNYAIDASATSSSALKDILLVDQVTFTNNLHGTCFTGIAQPLLNLQRSIFNLPDVANAYGFYFNACTGYTIDENTVNDNYASTYLYGGIINKSGTANNLAYRNTFNSTDNSLNAYRRNAADNGLTGLQMKCNTFNTTIRDITLTSSGPPIGDNVGRINAQQGQCFPQGDPQELTGPAGNQFFNGCGTSSACHLYKDVVAITFNYNYHNTNPPWNPIYKTVQISKTDCAVQTPFDFADACPSDFGGGCDPNCNFAAIGALNDQIIEEKTQIDGGNTAKLLSEIGDASVSSTELKSDLLAASPYLSDEVLDAVINRNPAMDENDLNQVLLANSPLSFNVGSTLESKIPELTSDASFEEAQEGVSAMSVLTQQIADIQFQLDRHVIIAVQYYIDSGLITEAIELLMSFKKVKDAIPFYLLSGDFESARELLKQISQIDLSDSDYCDLMAIQIDLLENGKSWKEMNDEQAKAIREIAEDSSVISRQAQNILEWVYNEDYPEDLPQLEDENVDQNSSQKQDENQNSRQRIVLYPNPANQIIQVDFSNSQLPVTSVAIYNSIGIMIEKVEVSAETISIEFNLSSYHEGVYIWQFKSDNKLLENKKVVIIK